MSTDSKQIIPFSDGSHRYPMSHWSELSRFVEGDERDPRDLFYLADDVWDAWPYAAHGISTRPGHYRFRFDRLHSFLKPYIKWYCYQQLLAKDGKLSRDTTILPSIFRRTDTYLIEHHCECADDITLESDFRDLWNAQLLPQKNDDAAASRARVRLQRPTRPFWKHLRSRFGFPHVVPPIAPHQQFRLTESAFDEHQVIPMAVINQLGNKLALHRDGRERLNRFHHLRLCVLMLSLALGRRIDELLTAPRGTGQEGPLAYYPARGKGPKGALWFEYSPNKQGPQDRVHVSSKWEDVTMYCVKELIRYSDEVRDAAPKEAQHLLILISHWNLTAGPRAIRAFPRENIEDFRFPGKDTDAQLQRQMPKDATTLSYSALYIWLHSHTVGGGRKPLQQIPGILQRWKITVDGTPDGEIYQLRTHQARHTRQSAIARDPHVPLLARQRDLNHVDRNMQVHYQHIASQQNEILLEKANNGQLVGPAMEWFAILFGTDYQSSDRRSLFRPGQPKPLPPRWHNLVQNNPQFMQFNRVPCGYCSLPQGPAACDDYLNCTTAEDGGCRWFLTDPGNAGMLIQITQTAHRYRQQEQESATAGHVVQAGKYAVLAHRAETVEQEALSHCDIDALPDCNQDIKERLKARRREIKEEDV